MSKNGYFIAMLLIPIAHVMRIWCESKLNKLIVEKFLLRFADQQYVCLFYVHEMNHIHFL